MLNPEISQRRRLLVVVDDEELVLRRVERNLREALWTAACFRDADLALEHLRLCGKPDLLIVDNRMPCIDGMDFIDLLRWPAVLLNSRVYLWSGVHPPADIRARADRKSVGILDKDDLLDRAAFGHFLSRHVPCGGAVALTG